MNAEIEATIVTVKKQIMEAIVADEKGIFGSPADRETAKESRANAFRWVDYLAEFCFLKGQQDISRKGGDA